MLSPAHCQLFVDWLTVLQDRGWRGIVHIAGKETFCQATVQALQEAASLVTVPQLPDTNYKGNSEQYIHQLLGTECDALCINAFLGFNPNALGAAAGCIRAGGILLLLTPPAEEWAFYPDPDYQRMLSITDSISDIPGRFVQHVQACLQDCQALANINEDGVFQISTVPASSKVFQHDTAEQQAVITAIKRVATGHARRPLVLQADRGRGKSAALGIAAAELMLEKPRHIVVTAPHKHNIHTLFNHAANVCGVSHEAAVSLHCDDSCLEFFPIDKLLQTLPSVDLLLIDEAAAIPSALLEQLTQHYKRIVFATTVHGYEGNGRGFAIRFLPRLQKLMPQLRQASLLQPIRYAEDDPLERFCNDTLLLKAALPIAVKGGEKVCRSLQRDEIVNDLELLQQLFGLLVNAHYQTSADDVRLMLDHPAVSLYVLQQDSVVLAVAMLMAEGHLNDAQVKEWRQNRRRYRGHLLPQALVTGHSDDILMLKTQRIVRIAVTPEYQRQGLGKQLLQYIEQDCQADFIGASFSAELPVLRFWQDAGFQAVRIGVHRESSTGQYAAMVLKALSSSAEVNYPIIRKQFVDNIAYQLLASHSDLEPDIAFALLQGSSYVFKNNDEFVVGDYCRQRCSFEIAQPSLYRFFLAMTGALTDFTVECRLLVRKLLQNQSWAVICNEFKLTGRAEAEHLVRDALLILLND